MYILGISCFYHDSSATLLKNGKIIAAAQEERFTRKKHDISFPENAIKYCLKEAKISSKEIDYIAFYEKPILKFERLLYQHLEEFPLSYKIFISSIPSWFTEKLRILNIIKKELKYEKDILFINHHESHLASSFFFSPFKEAALLSVDGVGEWTTTCLAKGQGNKIKILKEIKFPSSIGLLYSSITAYLGFSVNNSEYKVMGLSPYGNMNKEKNIYYNKLKKVVDMKKDGSYHLNMDYFDFTKKNRMPSKKLCSLLGGLIRKKESEVTQRHKDIAAALQMLTEDLMTSMLNYLHKITKSKNLIISGGVGLNSVYNGKILSKTPFENFWSQPDPGDGGTSLGAASYVYYSLLNNKRQFTIENASFGPSFSDEEIKEFLDKNNIKYTKFKDKKELVNKVAQLIYDNKVIGWFQGRMEWGPRALGNRSILTNPCNPNAKELLNEKVKHREKFRPFAPVVCADDSTKYFECDSPLPSSTDFMLMVYPVKKKWRKKIPSVTHIDGSGRLQTIKKSQNKLYYDLIKKFGKLSGIPILINTSFNIRGEPIVLSPYDAYKCMMGTGIDYLIIGNFFIKRNSNLRDEWNSEKYAKD